MAYSYWTNGNEDGEYDEDLNYSGNHPGVGDDLVFDGRSSDAMSLNVAHSIAELLGSVTVERANGSIIGTSGSPLQLSAGRVIMRGTGHLYFENGSISDTAVVIVNAPSGGAHLGCNTAKIGIIRAVAGPVTLTSTLTGLDELHVGNSKVTIESANTIADVIVSGAGNVECLAPVTRLFHNGTGTFTQVLAGGAISSMYIAPRATVVYKGNGTITKAFIDAEGHLDASQSGTALTITDLWRHPDGKYDRRDATTLTNPEHGQ
jgi:hypothetical protein